MLVGEVDIEMRRAADVVPSAAGSTCGAICDTVITAAARPSGQQVGRRPEPVNESAVDGVSERTIRRSAAPEAEPRIRERNRLGAAAWTIQIDSERTAVDALLVAGEIRPRVCETVG